MEYKINIYLTAENRKALDKKMAWYKVSVSTMVDKICHIFIKELNNNAEKVIDQTWTNEYYYKPRGRLKTSCKPKYFKTFNFKKNGKSINNMLATNCLLIWLNKDLQKICNDNALITRIYSLIDNELNKAVDKFWNYNEQIRNTRRMLKDDREYWKRAIEEEENKR